MITQRVLGISVGAKILVPGNPFKGLWFFSMVFIWLVVALSIYASYMTAPELVREDPLSAFGWVILPLLLAIGATWVWWDDVGWWREARKVASLVRWYKGGEVAFSEEVEASVGEILIKSGVGYVPSALPGRVRAVMEYEAVFTGPEEGVKGDRFGLPEEALGSAGVIYKGYYWLEARLPAVLVKRPTHDVLILVYDPNYVRGRSYAARAGSVEVTAETTGWGIKAAASGEPGRRVWASLRCKYGDLEATMKLLNGEGVPVQKELQLVPREPVVMVMARYMEEPKQVIKALRMKRQTAVGSALHNCALEAKAK